MTIEEFLFTAFRDTARRVLWFVDAGEQFESQEYCSKFYSPDIRKLAEEALISGDTRKFDDTLSSLLINLHSNFGYDTKRPQWWSDPETSPYGTGTAAGVHTNSLDKLNLGKKPDAWAKAIATAYSKLPSDQRNETQVWAQLLTLISVGYKIEEVQDERGNVKSLKMNNTGTDRSNLSWTNFKKRWKRYTTN